jgi:DNA invertase Pin-like site-specific DNA recombinase
MLVGYARVSTVEQNLQLQLDALDRAGCERIFADKLSGSTLQRPGLTEAMNYLREGDCLAVWKLDRLGRTMRGLIDFVDELQCKRINFQSLTDGINTESATGRFFFHLIAALAQMERELLIERTQAGLLAARKAGRKGGRPRVMTKNMLLKAEQMVKELPLREAAKELGVSVATLYRWFPPVKVIKTVNREDLLLNGDNGSLNRGSKLLN